MKVPIHKALDYVATHPSMKTDPIDTPVWELVALNLFEIANSPEVNKRGSMARATRAQKIIANRQVGTRRPGTKVATMKVNAVTFRDLTKEELV